MHTTINNELLSVNIDQAKQQEVDPIDQFLEFHRKRSANVDTVDTHPNACLP